MSSLMLDAVLVLSDIGKDFNNLLMLGICKIFGIDTIHTMPYKASTNNNTEIMLVTLISMRGQVVSEAKGFGGQVA